MAFSPFPPVELSWDGKKPKQAQRTLKVNTAQTTTTRPDGGKGYLGLGYWSFCAEATGSRALVKLEANAC